jgi:hypothetical protein
MEGDAAATGEVALPLKEAVEPFELAELGVEPLLPAALPAGLETSPVVPEPIVAGSTADVMPPPVEAAMPATASGSEFLVAALELSIWPAADPAAAPAL